MTARPLLRLRLALAALILLLTVREANARDPIPGDACGTGGVGTNAFQWAGANPDGGYFNGMFCNGGTYTGIINFQSTGKVGIGTTTPLQNLQVVSSGDSGVQIGPTTATSGNANLYLSGKYSGTQNDALIVADWGGALHLQPSSSSDYVGLRNATATDVLVVTGSKVGIGTTAPTQPLDVRGSTSGIDAAFRSTPSTQNVVVLDNLTGAANMKNEISLQSNSTEKWSIGNDLNGNGSQNFFIWDSVGLASRLFINPLGSVGIGTTGPAAALDVAGEIRTTGNTLACSSSTTGAIRYNSSTRVFDYCGGAGPSWTAFGSSGSTPLSGLTAAMATNTINNAANAQTWNWNSLTTGNGLTLGSSSLTTGNLLNLSVTNASMTGDVLESATNSTANGASAIYVYRRAMMNGPTRNRDGFPTHISRD
jgi:hypothetical protein